MPDDHVTPECTYSAWTSGRALPRAAIGWSPQGVQRSWKTQICAAQISRFNYNESFLVVCLQLKTDLCVAETLLVSPCSHGEQVNVMVKITNKAICSMSGKRLRPFLSSDMLGLCAFIGNQTRNPQPEVWSFFRFLLIDRNV